MKIYLEAAVMDTYRGVDARAEELRLIGHGHDTQSALESLLSIATAWCTGLRSVGRLEQVVRQRRLRTETSDSLTVELVTASLEPDSK